MEDAGADLGLLDNGFARMDKLFGFMHDAELGNSIGLSLPFLGATKVNGTLALDRDEASKLIVIANSELENDIEQGETVLDAIQDFVDFYNNANSNDRNQIYNYLDNFGFINLVITNPGGGGGTPPGQGGTPPGQVDIIEIIDDEIAQAAPSESEELPITPAGAKLEFTLSGLVIDVAKDAYEVDSTITVETFDRLNPVFKGLNSEFQKLEHMADVYKISSADDFEGPVTVSIPVTLPEGFEDFHKLGLYSFDPVFGEWTFIKGTYDEETGLITAQVSVYGYFGVMVFDRDFEDIEDNWAKDYIKYLASKRVINGFDARSYKPNNTLTRAEFVKLLVYVSDMELGDGITDFGDVDVDDWFAASVSAADDAGIIDPSVLNYIDEDGKQLFRPNDAISREEMVTMLMALVGEELVMDYRATYADVEMMFTDDENMSDWSIEAIKGAYELELINGKGMVFLILKERPNDLKQLKL